MPEYPDAPRRHSQRRSIFGFFFLSGLMTAAWSSRIPDIQRQLHLDNAALGTVLFLIPAGLMTGLLVAGRIIAGIGAGRVLFTSCIISALLLVLAGLASSATQLVIVLFMVGLGRTIYNLAANTRAVELQQLYTRPVVSMFHGVWSLACFVSAGLGTLMIILGYAPFIHFMVVALIVVLFAFVFNRKQAVEHIPLQRKPLFVMPDRYLLVLGLIAFCAMLCEGAVFDWSVNYFEKVVHAKKSQVTAGYSAFIIMMAIGRLAGDRIIAALGVYRVLVYSGLFMAAGFAIAAFFPFLFPAVLAFLLIGIGDAVLVPVVYMMAAKSGKMTAAYALTSVTFIGYSGFVLGPLMIGHVSQAWGMPAAFLVLSVFSLIMIVLTQVVRNMSN
ncbi:MAG TPA: MFS transporter [Flavisolibacter sp.]